jgi:hypothetical protein
MWHVARVAEKKHKHSIKERDLLEDLVIDGKVKLKCILKYRMERR